MSQNIVEGRCKICDRLYDAERGAAFEAQNYSPDVITAMLEHSEGETRICVQPGSVLCLSRAIDWRQRCQEAIKHSTAMANDTLVAVSEMVKEHNKKLEAARTEGRASADPVITELRARVDLLTNVVGAVERYIATMPDAAHSDGGHDEYHVMMNCLREVRNLVAMVPEARTWQDGVQDSIRVVMRRRDELQQLASPMVTPSAGAIQMCENIMKSLRAVLAAGKLERG